MHCNLPIITPALSALITTPCQVWRRWTYPLPYYSVFAAFTPWSCPLTLWSWPFTWWPWTFAAYRLWRDETLYQIRTQSNNPRRSYCDFTVWPYDLEHVLSVALGSGIIFTKFDLRLLIRARIIVFLCLYVISSCDLNLRPVDHKSSWYIKCHEIKVCTKFERNQPIPDWIIDNFANFCTRCVTPWPWPLAYWPWTPTALLGVMRLNSVQNLSEIE